GEDVASEIEGIGSLVDDGYVVLIREHIAYCPEGAREIHGMWIGTPLCRHSDDVLLFALFHCLRPRRAWPDLTRLECAEEGGHCRVDIPDDSRGDCKVTLASRGRGGELYGPRGWTPEGVRPR